MELHSVATPVLEAAIAATAGFGLHRLQVRWRRRPFGKLWDAIVGNADEVHIVYADVALPEFDIPTVKAKRDLPRNVPLLGVQEAVGLSDLYRSLHGYYGDRRHNKKKIQLHSARDFNEFNETIVCLGGPSVNRVTDQFLNHRRLDSKFRMVYPQHQAEDAVDATSYDCVEEDGEIVRDYGFILVAKNPLNPRHTVCTLFGIWPQGSRAAVKTLVEPAPADEHYKDLLARVKARSGALAVVQTEVAGIDPGEPSFVKVRGLVN
jgi:hypothetical protein